MDIWNSVLKSGIDRDELISKSMLSPATCCLVNEDKEKTVEKAFLLLKRLAQDLKEEYKLT